MFPDGRRLGAHLPVAAGLARAADRAREIGARALQIFADNPTAWRRRSEASPDQMAFRTRLDEWDLHPLAIHASYLINLAGPEPELRDRSVGLLAAELLDAPGFGAALVNVHIGSHRDTTVASGIDRLAEGVARVLDTVDANGSSPTKLVLENSAGGGFGIGTGIDELAAIATAIEARGVAPERVGFCLDTAHAWGAGLDMGSEAGVDDVLAGFDAALGLRRLAMVHLNDSRAERGSRQDRHEHLGAGRIGVAGFRRILTHPGLAAVPVYLETPGMDEGYDAVNLGRARDIIAGRPLATLPPEAMTVRSSASRLGRASSGPASDPPGSA